MYFGDIPGAKFGKVDKIMQEKMEVTLEYLGKEKGNDGKMHDRWKLVVN